jgi:hypothetical protein
MPGSFLDQLDLTPTERRQLSELGASSPIALAHMIDVSRAAFEAMVGTARGEAIERGLHSLLTDEERHTIGDRAPRYSLGARLGPAPKLPRKPDGER